MITEQSLVAKLATLKSGETVYLDDRREDGVPLNKAVQSAVAKSYALRGRKFTTQTWAAVRVSPSVAKPILAITRIDGTPGDLS